jgi:hypothetical protein
MRVLKTPRVPNTVEMKYTSPAERIMAGPEGREAW